MLLCTSIRRFTPSNLTYCSASENEHIFEFYKWQLFYFGQLLCFLESKFLVLESNFFGFYEHNRVISVINYLLKLYLFMLTPLTTADFQGERENIKKKTIYI
jgi:hypothetical protein